MTTTFFNFNLHLTSLDAINQRSISQETVIAKIASSVFTVDNGLHLDTYPHTNKLVRNLRQFKILFLNFLPSSLKSYQKVRFGAKFVKTFVEIIDVYRVINSRKNEIEFEFESGGNGHQL